MKEVIERKIMNKEDQIKNLMVRISDCLAKLKKLTFREVQIEEYVIVLAMEMKNAKDEINRLQYEIYELMQILNS